MAMLSPELLKKVRQVHIKTNHLVTETIAGSYQSAFRGKGMEFQEVRTYVPGDDIRDIDWNVTARVGEPHVKLYHEERELTVILLIDLSASGMFGSHGYLKRNLIAELAAIMAFSAIKNNDKVGVILFTNEVEHYIPPKKGRGHVWRVIREILQAQVKGKTTDINQALKFLNQLSLRRSVVFVLSDFLAAKNYQSPLQVAAKKHDLVCMRVQDPHEFKLPAIGWINVEDPETGKQQMINANSQLWQQDFQQTIQKHIEQTQKMIRKVGATEVNINCTQDYMLPLMQLFSKKERQR